MEYPFISSQITTFTNGKQRISLYDHLKLSSIANYAEIHANKEIVEGEEHKRRSLIYVELQDYSSGTGDKLIRATSNFLPEYFQTLLDEVRLRPDEFQDSMTKIFGPPNEKGLSRVEQIQISRTSKMNIPWSFQIRNGVGKKLKTKTGGFSMEKNSFQKESEVGIRLSDKDFSMLLYKVDRFIRLWEISAAPLLITEAKKEKGHF